MKKVLGICVLLLALILMPASGVQATDLAPPGSSIGEDNPPVPPSGPVIVTGEPGEDGREGDPDDIIEGNRLTDGAGEMGGAQGGGDPADREFRDLLRQIFLFLLGLQR